MVVLLDVPIIALLLLLIATVVQGQTNSDDYVRGLINDYNDGQNGADGAINLCNKNVLANWDVQTNVGVDQFLVVQSEAALNYSNFRLDKYNEFWKDIPASSIGNEQLRRQLSSLQKLGTAALSDTDFRNLSDTVNRMSRVYNTAVICPLGNSQCNENDALALDPHITLLMASSSDYTELEYTWTEWHDRSGKLMRADYGQYVELMNKVADVNNHANAAKWWQSSYEDLDMDIAIAPLWDQVEPLYKSLHTYVRNKLRKIYGTEMDKYGDNMPAHLLGNMWAQSWTNLYDRIKPFEVDSLGKVTENMAKQNYTVMRMFDEADDFFTSMGLDSNRMSYTGLSVIENPTDRTIACHASAWDFCKDNDFRIKMCTKITYEDFITVHHEMGHIQYYIQYANQELQHRGGANPAFHEAIGDTIALSFATPKHLFSIGLLDELEDSLEGDINALFLMALERVAFLPFGLLIDKWRWDVFSEAIPNGQWNAHWWALRLQYQGIVPPTERSEEFFDPGAKYHVPANSQYIGYFFAHILEFQFYRSLCVAAGQFKPNDPSSEPLHKCDFYGSKSAGDLLKSGLELGTSRTWQEVLEVMTGSQLIDGSALIDYFRPLKEYLDGENEKSARLDEVRATLVRYDAESAPVLQAQIHADWAVTTDLESEEKQSLLIASNAQTAQFVKQQYQQHFANVNYSDFDDVSVSRQLRYLGNMGTNILSDSDLLILNDAQRRMQEFYNRAKVCPYQNRDCNEDAEGLALNPGIETVMAESTDFDELQHVWTKWHDNSGGLMRTDYALWMEMSNQAAIANGFKDTGEMWRFDYEYENLEESMLKLWNEVKPLYDELHTYVRHKLIELYGVDKINVTDELIPAHLLGNMWAQSWVHLYERIKPFKEASDIDVTASMVAQNYTALQMFQLSDQFYKDLGLKSSEMSYTGQSIIEQPPDRLIVCHASAWDFLDGEDFRIKQCTLVNMEHLTTVHHEMGHIQYFIEYAEQPIVFRNGANPGFHEAIGDLIVLSVATPKHLEKIGLLHDYKDTAEDNINALLKTALERVAFLPFGLLIDMYRWDLFSGKVQPNQWHAHWEELRETYQMIRSPVQRTENHFDAAAKFHVASGYQYINYFIAHILQFQLHKSLCQVAGQYDPADPLKPLHKCDIDGSLEAGSRLRAGLSQGLSQHWSETLFLMTGERDLSAAAILEYFAPLMTFLKEENANWNLPDEEIPLVPIIVGAVIGGALLIGLVVAISYYCIKKNRKIPLVNLNGAT